MQWQPYRLRSSGRPSPLGPVGRPLNGHVFPCAYCKGTGNQVHMRSKCPVCRGKGVNKISDLTPLAVACAFCRGAGESERGSHTTCPACRGKGVLGVKEPSEKCDLCRGVGRVTGTQLPCLKCKGAGVFTVKTRQKVEEPEVALWRRS